MSHELVAFPNGSFSVKPLRSAEAMHSHIGPWQEASVIYIEPSDLARRLEAPELPGPQNTPLVIYDLGMGIAANALAAVECFLNGAPRRDLHLISFEKHLDGLRLALENEARFPWIKKYQGALEQLLATRQWTSPEINGPGAPRIRWQLREGDFLEQNLSTYPKVDLVFFDFYSPKACPELWGPGCFENVRAACAPHAELFTYSASTSARAAMLLAGFSVGAGALTSAKSETTTAAVRLSDLKRPLGLQWLEKLDRSSKPLPPGLPPSGHEHALALIRRSPQFSGSLMKGLR